MWQEFPKALYPIGSSQQTVCLVAFSYLVQRRPAILVFIVRLQRVSCPSECIDNLEIVKDVLATPQAIAGVTPLHPFRHENIIEILREVGTE